MSRPKKKIKKIEMSKTAFRRLQDDMARKMIALSMSYLMDEFNYDAKALCDFYDGMERYLNAIDEKLITLHKVEEIIKEHANVELKW